MTHDQALIILSRAVQSLTVRVAALEQAGPATVPDEVATALAALSASDPPTADGGDSAAPADLSGLPALS